jgi:predicted TPR repeat methyltransferase
MKEVDSAIKMNKLGMTLFAQKKWNEAIQAYQSAIDLRPDYTDAYYNLGLALNNAGRRPEAMNTYEALMALYPNHFGGLFQLGCLWMQQRQYKTAAEKFLLIEKNYPYHLETEMNLAACYLELGFLNDAKIRYSGVLDHSPTDTQALFNLGVISMREGQFKEAIEFYLQAVKIDTRFYDAHNNLGVAYLTLKDQSAALLHFRAAAQLQPNNAALRHTIMILSREKNISDSPPEYIRSLFDSYADHYDAHLAQSLHYQVPQHLRQMIEKARGAVYSQWDILDLGCGTGLSGELLKGYANRLIGVDLSSKMLAIAEQKHLYDELIESDILAFLQSQPEETYELIVAADVLVYSGDLAAIIAAVSRVLKLKGIVAFNLEISRQDDYLITDSGRFAHSKNYMDQLALKNHLQLLQYQTAVMRTQNEIAVSGHFYLLEREV